MHVLTLLGFTHDIFILIFNLQIISIPRRKMPNFKLNLWKKNHQILLRHLIVILFDEAALGRLCLWLHLSVCLFAITPKQMNACL